MKNIALVSIIDDDQFFQYNTKLIFEDSGCIDHILQFADGEEAINYFLANKNQADRTPDLVFLDLNMPYLDGWQFLDEFTINTFEKKLITIYICSSSNSRLDRERFAHYTNLEGYLLKPISKSEVLTVLNEELIKLNSKENRKVE